MEGVSKTYRGPGGRGVAALRGVSLSLSPGECVVVIGPSGAGKTTALRMVAGLEVPDTGTIQIGGRDMRGVPPQERGVAMVFQDHPLFPHLTVAEHLGFGLRLRGMARGETDRRVAEVTERLGLGPLLGRRPDGLSGGERQRVALGMALARRPSVLLLDEPLAHLDPVVRGELRGELQRIRGEAGWTMLYVTHDREEAPLVADRVAVLAEGVVRQVGTWEELRRRPADDWVARWVGGRGGMGSAERIPGGR